MTAEQIVKLMVQDTPLSKLRSVFYQEMARIEQASAQRRVLDVIRLRRMEFQAALRIAKTLGVEL